MSASLPADDDEVLLGDEAVEHVADTWSDIGQGKVEIEVIGPWLIIRRNGGDYTFFLSITDDTTAVILDDEATTRHIPEEHRPAHVIDAHVDSVLGRAFNADSGGGTYPLPSEGVWSYNFIEDDDRERSVHEVQIAFDSAAVYLDGDRIDPDAELDDAE